MNFLAINTAGRATQIAMQVNGKKILNTLDFSRHSENLFPLLEKTLTDNGLKLADFDCFSGVVGPGSFTGIRIGLSVIKGFAFALQKQVVAVSSLEILAYNRINSKSKLPIVAVINAGSGLVYHQVFEKVEKNGIEFLSQVSQARVDKIKHFSGYIHSNFNDNVQIVYNHNNEKDLSFADLLGESEDFSAESLFLATNNKILIQDFSSAVEITPLYLRVSQAEQMAKDLSFTKAGASEIDNLCILENQDDEWDLPWTKTCIEQSFANPNYECYILKSGEDALGFVSLNMLPDEAEILRVVVLKKSRLLGLGQKMLLSLIDTLREKQVKSVFLEVNEQNYPAFSLYQKIGFKQVGRRKDYYAKGESAVVMRLDL